MGHSLKHDFVLSRTLWFLQPDLAVAHHLCPRRPCLTAVTLTLSSGDRLIGNLAQPSLSVRADKSRETSCIVLMRSMLYYSQCMIDLQPGARVNGCFRRQMRCAV